MDNTIGFVSRNLVTKKNFVKFRDGQIFTSFRAKRNQNWWVTHGMMHACHVGDTWLDACMPCRLVQSIKMDWWKKREKKRKGREGNERGKQRSVTQ